MAKVSQMALPDATGNAGGFHSWHTQIVTSIGSDSSKVWRERECEESVCYPLKNWSARRMMGSSRSSFIPPSQRALGSSSLSKCQRRCTLAIHAGGPRAPWMAGISLPDAAALRDATGNAGWIQPFVSRSGGVSRRQCQGSGDKARVGPPVIRRGAG